MESCSSAFFRVLHCTLYAIQENSSVVLLGNDLEDEKVDIVGDLVGGGGVGAGVPPPPPLHRGAGVRGLALARLT